jgi:hypothetical protein
VGDHDDRRPVGVELVQQIEDGLAGRGVEVAGGLVGQDDRRVAGQRAGDRHPLPFPARQLGRPRPQLVAQAHPGQRRRGAAAAPGQAHAGVQQSVGDVVQRGGVLVEEKLLEDEPDRDRPQPGQLPVGHVGDVQAGDPHRPGGGLVQGAHQVQQRRLARPRRAGHRHQFPVGDGEADPA